MGLRDQTQASRVLTCWYQESSSAEPPFWPKLEELIKIKAFLLAVSLLDLMLERNKTGSPGKAACALSPGCSGKAAGALSPGSPGKAAGALSPGLSLQLLTSALSYTGADAGGGGR